MCTTLINDNILHVKTVLLKLDRITNGKPHRQEMIIYSAYVDRNKSNMGNVY